MFQHRRGHLLTTPVGYPAGLPGVNTCRLTVPMTPDVNTDDLIDAQGIAELLGLTHRNTVSGYQRRYPDMPRPVIDLGRGRPRLWSRAAIERWAAGRQ